MRIDSAQVLKFFIKKKSSKVKKRSNNGRMSNKQRGNCVNINCSHCKCFVRKDKAIINLGTKFLLDGGVRQDFRAAEAADSASNFKICVRSHSCMSCARHLKQVISQPRRRPHSCGRRILYEKKMEERENRRRYCNVPEGAKKLNEKNAKNLKNSAKAIMAGAGM